MASNFQWHGDEAKARIRAEMGRRAERACVLLAGHAKALIGVEGTARRGKSSRGKRKGSIAYGADPSAPGSPPRVQAGHLRRSVAWEVRGLIGMVGTSLAYGKMLEFGTRKMAARPWLGRAKAECRARIMAILNAPMK